MKKFDINLAKKGWPVVTRDGRKARIVCFDRKSVRPIMALTCYQNKEWAFNYLENGLIYDEDIHQFDLFLTDTWEGHDENGDPIEAVTDCHELETETDTNCSELTTKCSQLNPDHPSEKKSLSSQVGAVEYIMANGLDLPGKRNQVRNTLQGQERLQDLLKVRHSNEMMIEFEERERRNNDEIMTVEELRELLIRSFNKALDKKNRIRAEEPGQSADQGQDNTREDQVQGYLSNVL